MRKHASWRGYFYLLPAALVLSIFVIYPLIYTIYLSFFKWNMVSPNKQFVGLANYQKILSEPVFQKVLLNTLLYTILFVLFSCLFPYIVSFLMDIVIQKGKEFYKPIFFIPAVISLVVASMVFTWILNPVSGPVAIVLKSVGITMPMWTNLNGWVISIIALITSWKVFGYNFIVIYAAIAGIDREMIEAAKLDRIPIWRMFLQLILPLSSSTGIYLFIMTIVQGLQYVFTPIKIITKGGPNNGSSNLIYYTYQKAFEMYKVGEASAISVITLLIFLVILVCTFKFIEKGVYYEN
ncbi:carbohydrate ABC transporter permease [Enterococcus camelliae]|uniref:Carbohydrate ABC transporter permease n=1 Tax=Enterococcus camelliae TaxID=453959 RepID=A0ABW5TH81_9ENTE